MILKHVCVENYRSIVDSSVVGIEDGVTVLIGKNEQGKTNFLRGIASFNEDRTYSPSDLPNHLRPSLDEKDPQTIPIVTLLLQSEAEDATLLKGIVDSLESAQSIKCVRYFGNNYSYSIGGSKTERKVPLRLLLRMFQRRLR